MCFDLEVLRAQFHLQPRTRNESCSIFSVLKRNFHRRNATPMAVHETALEARPCKGEYANPTKLLFTYIWAPEHARMMLLAAVPFQLYGTPRENWAPNPNLFGQADVTGYS